MTMTKAKEKSTWREKHYGNIQNTVRNLPAPNGVGGVLPMTRIYALYRSSFSKLLLFCDACSAGGVN
jgi:hypothetical protein